MSRLSMKHSHVQWSNNRQVSTTAMDSYQRLQWSHDNNNDQQLQWTITTITKITIQYASTRKATKTIVTTTQQQRQYHQQ